MNKEKTRENSPRIDNLAYSSRDAEHLITSARTPVHYPLWLHCVALVIFLMSCAKIPHGNAFVRDHLPEVMTDASSLTESDMQITQAGGIIVAVLSGLFGAAVLYFVHRHFARSAKTAVLVKNNPRHVAMWELIVILSLILPDLWFAVIGSPIYTSWVFFALFTVAIVSATLFLGKAKNLLRTLPISLFLVFAV